MANKNGKRGGFGLSPVSLTSPGTVFTIGFIALAIGLGMLLARGATPKYILTEPPKDEEYEMIPLTPDPKQKNLQLKTLKFRSCINDLSVELLVDRSGSMKGDKLDDLKEALHTFTSGLGKESIIGLSSFSSNDPDIGYTPIDFTENIKISHFVDVESTLASAIGSLYAAGATNTRTAFESVRPILFKAQEDFPGKEFALIFLSDGIPEYYTGSPICESGIKFGTRCYSTVMDPNRDPSIPTQIKDKRIKIYSIAIYDKDDRSDNYFLPYMRIMMKQIASTPSNYYETPDSSKLKSIYKEISQKICSESG